MYYSILRPLLLTVLASLPASLVFNLLSFGIYSTQCLYRNHFLLYLKIFCYHFLSVIVIISCCLRTRCVTHRRCRSQFSADQLCYTFTLISTFLPADALKTGYPFTVACSWRDSCRRCIIARLRIVAD